MQLDPNQANIELKKSLALAMERLDMDLKDIDATSFDIQNEFPNTKLTDIRCALKKGALGAYGRTFKLSTQEVCFWIREYKKSRSANLGI